MYFKPDILTTFDSEQKAAYTPVKVDADTLLSIPRAEVFVCRPSGKALGKRATFYR